MTVDAHLRGQQNLVAGIYPLLQNESCWFLAIDFDDEGWQKDITTLGEVCSLFEIPIAVEPIDDQWAFCHPIEGCRETVGI